MLGVIAMQKGDLPRAIDSLHKAIASDPAEGMAHANLGLALMASSQPDKALAAFQKATSIEPSVEIDKKSLFRGTDTRQPACACPHADRLEPA